MSSNSSEGPEYRGRFMKKERNTQETNIKVEVDIDGKGSVFCKTGYPFIDHLVSTFGKHSMINISVEAKSNDSISHHLIEDLAITLSQTLNNALSDRQRIRRFGYAIVPMDESLAVSSIDLAKRQFFKLSLNLDTKQIEGIPREDLVHFMGSLLQNLNACTHICVQYGENDHHKIEAAMKALAIALRMAASIDDKQTGVPSTKGVI
ncbi:MAG: imidazoleglycerol-phosphate dehydratase [Nitrososphaeraceae archaeon]|nr:imidazoleglycerol-phosphate dehydratase [Nitrososphaeraceae archaeon]